MRHFNPQPLFSFSTYLLSCSTSTKSPDLVRHVGICTGLLLQRKLWLNSFNPRPLSSSQRNAEPKCKNANAPSLLLSYVHKCGCSDNPVSNPIYRSLDYGSYDSVRYLARVKLGLKVRVEVPQAQRSLLTHRECQAVQSVQFHSTLLWNDPTATIAEQLWECCTSARKLLFASKEAAAWGAAAFL